jgi:hypothetical protein
MENMTETLSVAQARYNLAQARVELHAAKLALAKAEAEANLPEEPKLKPGGIVRFKVQFREGEHEYTYVALRVAGGWRLGDRLYGDRTITWAEVVKTMKRNYSGIPNFETIP